MIYFDNNATTRLAPAVLEAMMPFLDGEFANPSSAYAAGKASALAVETARESVASLVGAGSPGEIVFTASGTESDNWAIAGAVGATAVGRHIVTTAVEHDAVRRMCEFEAQRGVQVTVLGVGRSGALDLAELEAALRPETAVVSIMLANNETGVIFPVAEAAAIVKERSNALFHVDAVNAAGKIAIRADDWDIDLLSISAHKFHGPKGVGALYIRNGVDLPPMFLGGSQESRLRAGTEAVHQIAGLGAAASIAADLSHSDRIAAMRDRLEAAVLETIPGVCVNGTGPRLPNTTNISFENINGEMILAELDAHSICVSTGSACHSAERRSSPVLAAMDVPFSFAMGSIRFSLSRFNIDREVDRVIEVLPGVIAGLAELSDVRDDRHRPVRTG